eukprot:g7960.t1
MYHCIQLKNFLSDNDSASTQKLYSKVETTKQKLKQLDLQSLQKKLNLRNEKMEMLVNELKKQKANIKQMEYDQTVVNEKYESDIKRLKDKAQLKLKQLQETFTNDINRLKSARTAANNNNTQQQNNQIAAFSHTASAIRLLETNLSKTNSQLLTSNATITKLRNEISYLNQQLEKTNVKLLHQTTEKNNLESKVYAMQRSLKTTQIKAIDYEGKAQQLEAQKHDLKSINRALRKELEMAETSLNKTKAELSIIKDNYLLVKNEKKKKNKNYSMHHQLNDSDDDDEKLLPLETPFVNCNSTVQNSRASNKSQQSFVKPSPKKELEKLLRNKKLMAAAVQVSHADDVIVDYILNVVTNELDDLVHANNKRSQLDDGVKEALFSLAPSIQDEYQKFRHNANGSKELDKKVKKILVNWAEIFTSRDENTQLKKETTASRRQGTAKSLPAPPGFEDTTPTNHDNNNSKNNTGSNNNGLSFITTSEKENEYIEILRILFPEISNLKQLLLLHGGDVNLTAESIFDELNSEEERFKIWFVHNKHGAATDENEIERKARERRMRQDILEKYFMRLEETKKCNPDFIGKYVANNFDNSKVRYRNDRVVSTKGERFIKEVKETKEQIQATSVSLAWVKRKRKGGQQKANLK